ncbi:aminotransferase class I/II-fold pyridoxal phosphate-dependent enzyme [Bradyrhizobium sp. IC3123]|uniref:threonine aldolase family protein n=1 Tax=Bradyrhizobium sp. IC3123 TaxID=2793803 RepID=UPI001CD2D4DC|nr:GntG family PLP-dependent aldolase [Bradyrhizobium sp. IC3123]MCA1393267.1 aminotransferase class I/II-fold pyridoxal phosphate-dependent enzyme [Bradyrhizobium sp. IC3123]
MSLIDLRSDLLAGPTPEMIEAMIATARAPSSYGAREDRHVRELEALTAQTLGTQDALFFPTCTMANQAALMVHCRPGDFIIADAESHVAEFEAASTAGVSNVATFRVAGVRGHLSPEQLAQALDQSEDEAMRVSVVSLENTHNRAGGTVMPASWQQQIENECRPRGIAIHLDGARLWNAAAYAGCEPLALARGVDSIAVSLNKALGAPLGAMLCGSSAFIKDASRVRRMLGGNWRPAGIVAAPAVVALKSMQKRITDDHANARHLGMVLTSENPWLSIDLDSLQTNIVLVKLRTEEISAHRLTQRLSELGVLVVPYGDRYVRLVIYAGIGRDQIDAVLSAFSEIGQSLEAKYPDTLSTS